jgi:hypothetical protein
MNKRLIELKIEAWDYACSKIPPDALGLKNHGDYFAEKFAELIVRECARCVTQPTIQAAGQTEFSMKALQDVLANDMKAYFGVTDV